MASAGKSKQFVLSIDQGTTTSRALIFDATTGERCYSSSKVPFDSDKPHVGWVEQDPEKGIYGSVESSLKEVLGKFEKDGHKGIDILGVGISNQRETTIVWDSETGEYLYPAIVWNDRRTLDLVEEVTQDLDGNKYALQDICGLPVDTYFSALKLRWMQSQEKVKQRIEAGTCMFGTVDSWLIYKLTGGKRSNIHVTDKSNASRTMLMNIKTHEWDDSLKEKLKIDKRIKFPDIRSSAERYGEVHSSVADGLLENVPITGCLGDQQASLVGHGCMTEGQLKSTYGTGCFMLYNTGPQLMPVSSNPNLLRTVAYQLGPTARVHYALEGAVASAGSSIKWLVDLGLIPTDKASETEARKAKESSVFFVSAFAGLKGTYWWPDATGIIVGLTSDTGKAEICKAALEGTAFQTRDVLDAMCDETKFRRQLVRVDGGMTDNKYFLQILADTLEAPVACSAEMEATALGAAKVAAVGAGLKFCSDLGQPTIFEPQAPFSATLYKQWREAANRSRSLEMHMEPKGNSS